EVLLLGGPNCYIKGMRDCWKVNIPKIWEERNFPLPEGVDPADLVKTPDNAQYFAAVGAVEFGKTEDATAGQYLGWEKLEWYVDIGRDEEKAKKGGAGGLAKTSDELESFQQTYRQQRFVPSAFGKGEVVEGFIGMDGGSTSTKAVLISKDPERRILAKAYQLSKGNPIEDSMEIFAKLHQQVRDQGAEMKVLGVGTTGYAKDILKDVVGADAAIVETVAHTQAGLHFYDDVDVICDIGGQDIKIIILKDGRVKDFKLNTQCSAGNGYFLQSTAQGFGYKVEEFADVAFNATGYPQFGYGCAVFMQSDIVDFQRQGWQPGEIMAGLCNVLPKNVWLYVSQIPNLAAIGRRFLLQGGTQYNLAAVKSQVDFIRSRFKGKDVEPDVIVHKHCGEAGAIGAGLEAGRLWDNGRQSTFIGLDAVRKILYKTTREEATRCYFCKNKCLRTFIDVKTSNLSEDAYRPKKSKVPLEEGSQRLIIATCEKGTVEDINEMRQIKGGLDEVKKANPNFAEIAARQVFKVQQTPVVADPPPKLRITAAQKRRAELLKRRETFRIGIPRVLNMYSQSPLFTGYLAALGIKPENMVFSDFTTEELYKEGAKRGAIDPCFPSKLGIPHIHNLLMVHHKRKPLDAILFPMIDCLTSDLKGTQGARSCPTVATTPAAVKAAFTKEGDLFAENNILFLDTFVNTGQPEVFERQMYDQFRDILGLTVEENSRAVREGYRALDYFNNVILRGRAREVLDELEREDRLGIVVLGRPYHNDPGCNHEILEEFQKLGYPVFTQDSLPIDDDILWRLFGDE
ncbi:MAG: CoA activase, partial [bacterium]|nr:CoA activase [bacterium]